MIRLFSIEDHWLVTDGLKQQFHSRREGIVISCNATGIKEALEGIIDDSFDIILLDLFLPGTDPIENIRLLRQRYPGKPIVILTGEEQEIWKMQVAEAGAMAYLTKHAKKSELTDTLERVYRGENILKRQLEKMEIRAGREDAPSLFNIKPSEKELLSQLASGLPQKQIAANLNLTESAVEKTLRKLRKQFSVSNTLELVRLLEQYRFFSGPGESSGRN